MTSPAITKSPDNQKVENKSPTHSARAASERPASAAAPAPPPPAPPAPSDHFSWLRIFKLADLMMKQGC